MTKLWKALCITVVAAGLSAPTQVHAQGGILCQLLGIGCPPPPPEVTQAEFDALQAQVNVQAGQIATLNADVTALEGTVADLEDQISELQGAIFDCELFAETEECDGQCVNTETNEEHCGACNNECDANEECLAGVCEVKECPPLANDPDGTCNQAVVDANGDCNHFAIGGAEGAACSDGNGCTLGTTCQAPAAGSNVSVCGDAAAFNCPGETCTSTGPTDADFECSP